MNVSKTELYKQPSALSPARAGTRARCSRRSTRTNSAQLGGEPYGALIGDYEFSHQPTDVQLLRRSRQDRRRGARAVLRRRRPDADRHGLLDRAVEPARPRQGLRHAGLCRVEGRCAIRRIRAMSACACRACCRACPTARSPSRSRSSPSRKRPTATRATKYGWMNAAYAMAANINRAFKEYGWTTRIRGVESGGEVDQPADAHLPDRRWRRRPEVPDRDRHHRPARGRAGQVRPHAARAPQEHRQGGVHRRPVALQAASHGQGPRTPPPPTTSRRAFLTCSRCRASRTISSAWCATRSARPRSRTSSSDWLQTWINQYVDGDPKNSIRSRPRPSKPLAAAKVEVIENEENPGYYSARFFLRPHYQLEGMDIGLSLVSRLPGAGTT